MSSDERKDDSGAGLVILALLTYLTASAATTASSSVDVTPDADVFANMRARTIELYEATGDVAVVETNMSRILSENGG